MSGRHRSYVFDEHAAGRLRYQEHHRPGPIALVVLVVAPGVVPVIFRDDVTSIGIGLFYYGVALFFLVLLYLSGWMNRIKVYDHAVVLDTAWPGGAPYVIPLSTIDPGRVRYHRRANFIGRRMGQGKRHVRTGPYASQAITFDGLSPRVARRRASDVPEAQADRVRPGARTVQVDGGDGQTLDLEVETWVVATGTPRRLLRALEQALVDAGRPEAAGMAERLLADPVVERWRQPLTEDEIYRDRAG
ncbi:hypothetical protein EF847_19545 [Actinobacteria bacterium YIM 96077]|uniref:Uncharacterized protein n=1 Tax=Phytoactinopolyspora halophila TaxID=1981511 RepID=A0A329QQ76_9ACTN|nr:hypothetical protein [Phytoactinopolyspora halophila]AYY14561.1 hypothetical protein EF847_19545 [Actinobacteria bacterium YIM 96077]RAW14061.1 hypothetical protein DPM12_11590 [Phytoactinopolyspora halophila]